MALPSIAVDVELLRRATDSVPAGAVSRAFAFFLRFEYLRRMNLLTPNIEPFFRAAGWVPGRAVVVDRHVPRAHPAFRILQAFGELTVGHIGTGEECASSDIEFGCPACPDEQVDGWQEALRTDFVCLGDVHHGHGQLWLDSQGRLFLNGLVASMMLFVGHDFAQGIEALLKGYRSHPMLLPSQEDVMVWGERFRAGDPRVLTPDFFRARAL
ncbi:MULTISPECIES: SUKH-3 domain-containing protein [Pseudomonas]|uniref:SUKH-3 domain-containing protein n=1 Tax=Pseudomonas TaxID=286 RepID=UPI0009B94941|nr:SUKH-3 domain-containing protein [Pseudomonas fluorescens]